MSRNLLLLAAILTVVPAYADLLGQDVSADYLYPDSGTVLQSLGSGTVTGLGFTVNSFDQHDYTVTGTQIILTNVAGGSVLFPAASFNGYLLTLTGLSPVTIVSVTTNAATNVSGFSGSDVSFDSTHVFLNMQSLTTDDGEQVVLDVATEPVGVPEPATVSLLGCGLAGFLPGRARRALVHPVFRGQPRAAPASGRRHGASARTFDLLPDWERMEKIYRALPASGWKPMWVGLSLLR